MKIDQLYELDWLETMQDFYNKQAKEFIKEHLQC